MSDWEDDDYANTPKITKPALIPSKNMDDDWEDEPEPRRNDRYRDESRDRHRFNNNRMDDGNDESFSFKINKSNVGLVIGRGGSKIKELEQKHRVKLNIDKESDRDGNAIITVKGSSSDADNVKQEVLRLVNSNPNRSDGGARSFDARNSNQSRNSYGNNSNNYESNRGSSRGYDSQRAESNETFEIYPDKVGAVIGSRGSTINELQSKFNVKINIDKNPNYNGKSKVNVSGGRDDVARAIQDIKNLVGEPNTNNAHQSYNEPEPMEYEQIDWQAAARESEEENRKRWAQLPPLQKNFYNELPDVKNMSAEKAAAIREENNKITVSRLILDGDNGPQVSNEDIPNPVETFEQCFRDYPDLMEQIQNQGFTKPSPIQAQAWPVLLKGDDLIGIAQTGTGKTLAFLLPAMIHTEYQSIPRSERGGPNVLVLAPTRELALQIEKEVAKYSFRGMKAVCVYGGGDRKAQINNIQTGVEIIIATPGRLNDLVEAKVIDVCTITFLILDEADRMLDMGFEPQIRKVLLNIRPDRQTVMTSATWPPGVRRLAQRYMVNPIQVCVGTLDLAAVHSVTQVIKFMEEDNKYHAVMDFVKNQMDPDEKAIIFCGKKARADDLSSEFSLKNICCQCIHGNRDQSDREQALLDIKDGVVKILIATDVASRGIDIQDLSYVINYDFPHNIEEYVHRVGRTGRAGKTGKSISYVTRSDWASAGDLIKILEEAGQEVPDELRQMKSRFDDMQERRDKERQSMGGGGRRFGSGAGVGRGGGGGRFGGGNRSRW